MRTNLLLFLLCCVLLGYAQTPIIDNWMLNTDGTTATYWENTSVTMTPSYTYNTTTDSADVTRVCYTADSVWIKCEGMTTGMGKFQNPGAPTPQGYTFRFPRNTAAATSHVDVPYVFSTGVLINGVPIFGMSNSQSWKKSTNQNSNMGDGYWTVDAWYGEGFVLDSSYGGHPQADGAYHSHATPKNLYTFPSSTHSPLVGFAFDGYPVYGPYGYTSAMNSASGVSRMTTSYRLRNITQRTTLPDGTVLTSPFYGPSVSVQHPLGEYIEDYEYVNGLGTLDYYNGRFCVTPEYPSGTYAYFVAADAIGDPEFPYYFGLQYYGIVDQLNLSPVSTITMPNNLTGCRGNITTDVNNGAASNVIAGNKFNIFPNPVINQFVLKLNTEHMTSKQKVKVYNDKGVLIHETNLPSVMTVVALGDDINPGVYFVHLTDDSGSSLEIQKIVVQ